MKIRYGGPHFGNRIFVMGCLSERYAKELPAELPEVDGWYGKFDWPAIVSDITGTQTSGSLQDGVDGFFFGISDESACVDHKNVSGKVRTFGHFRPDSVGGHH